jgi:hypothetical protein
LNMICRRPLDPDVFGQFSAIFANSGVSSCHLCAIWTPNRPRAAAGGGAKAGRRTTGHGGLHFEQNPVYCDSRVSLPQDLGSQATDVFVSPDAGLRARLITTPVTTLEPEQRTGRLPQSNRSGDTIMHCRHCHSLMAQTHSELNPLSKQSWYKCRLCGRAQFVSEPRSPLWLQGDRPDTQPPPILP